MDILNRWLAARTFHHRQFADIAALVQRKQSLGLRLSLAIPTLNEAATIGRVVEQLVALRDSWLLLDEIAVIDSGSEDATLDEALAAGADVFRAADILSEAGHHRGKGENLWKALHQLNGDILICVDADILNMHPRFVTGLVGPLLDDPAIGYVKACYDRPDGEPGTGARPGGGRVTEILVRPYLNLHFPELSGFIQPLAGEFAARRSLLEAIPFPVGYGVEAAHLIDLHSRYGLELFAQSDLGERHHRHRSTAELGRMAFAILQVLERRLPHRRHPMTPVSPVRSLSQFSRTGEQFRRQTHRLAEPERQPIREIAAYARRRQTIGKGLCPEWPAAASPLIRSAGGGY